MWFKEPDANEHMSDHLCVCMHVCVASCYVFKSVDVLDTCFLHVILWNILIERMLLLWIVLFEWLKFDTVFKQHIKLYIH